MSSKVTSPVHDRTHLDEYQLLIDRLLQAIDDLIPPGSIVLVVSKGDPALLALGQRSAWHFPRAANGDYSGFHPADSNDAIARLDVQRSLGARYLVLPATSAWWLAHYPEFFAYVRSCGRPLFEEATVGAIFELSARSVPVPAAAAGSGRSPQTEQLVTLLEAVLPRSATIATRRLG